MSTAREDIGWLVPIFGPERLLRLSETFRQRTAGTISSYCPWMAVVGLEAKLRNLHAVPNAKGSVVVDRQYLEALAEHVEIDPRQPLAFFKIDTKEMKIWRTPSPDIQAQFESAKSLLYTSLPDIAGVFDNLVDMTFLGKPAAVIKQHHAAWDIVLTEG